MTLNTRKSIGKRFAFMLLASCASLYPVSSALAFSLFGLHLWGEKKTTDDSDMVIAEPKRYEVAVSSAKRTNRDGSEADLEDVVKGASGLVADEKKPASGSAGLLAKARGDYRRILAALYGEGRYGGKISIKVNGQEANDIAPDAELPDQSKIEIDVDPGAQFIFSRTTISQLAPPPQDRRDKVPLPEESGFAPGDVARSATILKAERLAIEAWRQQGYAKATATGQDVVADHADDTIAADISIDPGQKAHYGPVTVTGTARMDPQFVAWMTGLKEGQEYDPDDIDKARKRLSRMEVFRAMSFQEAEKINPDGSLPMELNVQERPPRRFGAGVSYSTLDGFGLETYWMHRNLFGKGERLRLDAKMSGIGGSQDNSFNPANFTYLLGATFTKPGVFTPDTDFVGGLNAKREVLDTYTETSVTAKGGFTHTFSDELSGSIFAKVFQGQFEDDYFGRRDFTTAGLDGNVIYDRRNNKTDASSGYYLEGNLAPFYEFHYGNFATRFTAEGRTYFGFGDKDRFVLAGRAKIGSIVGASIADVPPDQLFFAGGGGSVRGYAYRNIGVRTNSGETIGGRSLVEASAEARMRVTDSIGVVGFVDGGYVGEESYPDFANNMKLGAGAGLRYLTGLGPIRLDVAVPLNKQSGDPTYGIYVGIGQAF